MEGITVVVSAVIFDDAGRVFLLKRSDSGLWCLPGGGMQMGESVEEAMKREIREETGLEIEVIRLIGIYSKPDTFAKRGFSGSYIKLCFLCSVIGGELQLNHEGLDAKYFPIDDLPPLFSNDGEVIEHALEGRGEAHIL
ncbi:MAG: NUDIX domain-containing protein [bacterium]